MGDCHANPRQLNQEEVLGLLGDEWPLCLHCAISCICQCTSELISSFQEKQSSYENVLLQELLFLSLFSFWGGKRWGGITKPHSSSLFHDGWKYAENGYYTIDQIIGDYFLLAHRNELIIPRTRWLGELCSWKRALHSCGFRQSGFWE